MPRAAAGSLSTGQAGSETAMRDYKRATRPQRPPRAPPESFFVKISTKARNRRPWHSWDLDHGVLSGLCIKGGHVVTLASSCFRMALKKWLHSQMVSEAPEVNDDRIDKLIRRVQKESDRELRTKALAAGSKVDAPFRLQAWMCGAARSSPSLPSSRAQALDSESRPL